jgi:hypothetical protein
MRTIKLLALALMVLTFSYCSEQNEILEQQDLTKAQLEIVKRIGIQNIISFDAVKGQLQARSIYPSEPLCQSLSYVNSEEGGWVIYEWAGNYYYGFIADGRYVEVVVREDFAKSFCKRPKITL